MTDPASLPVGDGTVVAFHYTLRNDSGKVVDKSDGEPLFYLHGSGQIVRGLEQALIGHVAGDSFIVKVHPEDAYGVKSGTPQAVPRSAFPAGVTLEQGAQFITRDPNGQPVPIWIAGTTDEVIFVEFDHPLAGQTLHFDVKVDSVRMATEDEKHHGHAHGPGGHGHHH